MSKHTGYYEPRDALQETGCAICRLGEKAVARYLAGLIYANANDYQVRADVKLACGFCNLHAWQLRDCHGAGLDMAILSADVLAEWLKALQGFTPQAPPPNLFQRLVIALGLSGGQPDAVALAETLAPQRPCLACQTRDEVEQRYIHHRESTLACLACAMLAELQDRHAVPPLLALVESRPAYEVTCAAADSLALFGDPAAIPVLWALLQDSNAMIPARIAALQALTHFDADTARAALAWAAACERPAVRDTAEAFTLAKLCELCSPEPSQG